MQKLLLAYKTKQEGRPDRTVNKKNERQRNSRQNKTDKAEPEKYRRRQKRNIPTKKTHPGACLFRFFMNRKQLVLSLCMLRGAARGRRKICAVFRFFPIKICAAFRFFPIKICAGFGLFTDGAGERFSLSVSWRAASVFLLEKTASRVYNQTGA